MSERSLSIVLSLAILLALAVWVPFLHFCHKRVLKWRARSTPASDEQKRL